MKPKTIIYRSVFKTNKDIHDHGKTKYWPWAPKRSELVFAEHENFRGLQFDSDQELLSPVIRNS